MQGQNDRYSNNHNNNNNNNNHHHHHRSGNQNTNNNRRVRTKYDTGNTFNRRPNYNNFNNNRKQTHRNITFDNSNGVRQRNQKERYRYTNNAQNNRRNNLEEADETQWFKVTIPHGVKSGKASIFDSLKSLCDKPFVPFNYQEEGQAIIFYVIGKDIGDALRSCSRRIKSPNGFSYTILVSRTAIPFTDINPEVIAHLKEAMSRRYDASQRVLNLSNLRSDPFLQEQGLFIPVSRPKMLMSVVRIIAENIPDIVYLNLSNNRIGNLEPLMPLVQSCKLLKHLDLSNNTITNFIPFDYLKGLALEAILLAGNPIVTSYKSREDFISQIRSIFPKLLKLDDEILPPPIKFEVDEAISLPPVQGSHMPEDTKQFILGFISQYYLIYDSENRQALVEAYHDQASFSFSISLQGLQQKQKVNAYFPLSMFQESRNLLRVKDRSLQTRLLKRGKEDIVKSLAQFPRTKHESESFLIDVNVINPGLINVVINGIYRELDEKRDREKRSVLTRAFCRNFLIIPNLIINDLLTVSNATVEQIQKYGKDSQFSSLLDQPSTSSTPLLASPPSSSIVSPVASTFVGNDNANLRDSLVRQFSQTTGMNTSFSSNCLQEFDFDYNKAIDAFQQLNSQGSIPAEAFKW